MHMHTFSRSRVPAEKVHAIEVDSFLDTKSSSEPDTLLSLSDVGFVSQISLILLNYPFLLRTN